MLKQQILHKQHGTASDIFMASRLGFPGMRSTSSMHPGESASSLPSYVGSEAGSFPPHINGFDPHSNQFPTTAQQSAPWSVGDVSRLRHMHDVRNSMIPSHHSSYSASHSELAHRFSPQEATISSLPMSAGTNNNWGAYPDYSNTNRADLPNTFSSLGHGLHGHNMQMNFSAATPVAMDVHHVNQSMPTWH